MGARDGKIGALLLRQILEVGEDKSCRVPELVGEIAIRLNTLGVEGHVEPRRHASHERVAQRVGAILADDIQGIDHVPRRL